MKESGARPEAIAFASSLEFGAFLSSFRKMGKVDLGVITYPFRANNNETPVLLNGQPTVIDVAKAGSQVDVTSDPTFREIQKRFPNASNDGDPPPTFSRVELLDGGQRFFFSFVLKNGCHACQEIGHASVAFDFDSEGRFLVAKLIGLQPESQLSRATKESESPSLASHDQLITDHSVGAVRIGMTFLQAQRAVPGSKLQKTMVGDGTPAMTLTLGGRTLMVLLPDDKEMGYSSHIRDTFHIFSILTSAPDCVTAAGVRPGMQLREVEQRYGRLLSIFQSEVEMEEIAQFMDKPPGIDIQVRAENGTAGKYRQGERIAFEYKASARVSRIVVSRAESRQ